MDNHGIRAGWPFDRQVDFPLGEKMQLKADAAGEEGGPGESPGGGTMDPGERMDGWRRMGWANEDNTAGAGWARVGRRLPTGGAPRVMDLDVSSGYPTALGQVDGRTMIRWPLTVRERPPTPHRTMFMDERRHDVGGGLHRDDGPATLFAGAARVWMQHGALHRAGGPAMEGRRRLAGLAPARRPDRVPGIGLYNRGNLPGQFTGATHEFTPPSQRETDHQNCEGPQAPPQPINSRARRTMIMQYRPISRAMNTPSPVRPSPIHPLASSAHLTTKPEQPAKGQPGQRRLAERRPQRPLPRGKSQKLSRSLRTIQALHSARET